MINLTDSQIIQRNIYQNQNPLLSLPNEIIHLILSFLKNNENDVIPFGRVISIFNQVCLRTYQITHLPVLNNVVEQAQKQLKDQTNRVSFASTLRNPKCSILFFQD